MQTDDVADGSRKHAGTHGAALYLQEKREKADADASWEGKPPFQPWMDDSDDRDCILKDDAAITSGDEVESGSTSTV